MLNFVERKAVKFIEDDRPASVEEAAKYIAALSREISKLAKQSEFHTVAYLLDLTVMEANNIADASRTKLSGPKHYER